jgi:hypothetical protein
MGGDTIFQWEDPTPQAPRGPKPVLLRAAIRLDEGSADGPLTAAFEVRNGDVGLDRLVVTAELFDAESRVCGRASAVGRDLSPGERRTITEVLPGSAGGGAPVGARVWVRIERAERLPVEPAMRLDTSSNLVSVQVAVRNDGDACARPRMLLTFLDARTERPGGEVHFDDDLPAGSDTLLCFTLPAADVPTGSKARGTLILPRARVWGPQWVAREGVGQPRLPTTPRAIGRVPALAPAAEVPSTIGQSWSARAAARAHAGADELDMPAPAPPPTRHAPAQQDPATHELAPYEEGVAPPSSNHSPLAAAPPPAQRRSASPAAPMPARLGSPRRDPDAPVPQGTPWAALDGGDESAIAEIVAAGLDQDARQRVVTWLEGRDARRIALACKVAKAAGWRSIATFIRRQLSHVDRGVRFAAADALSVLGDAAVIPFLRRMSTDPDEDVRGAAAYAVTELEARRTAK